MSLTSEKIRLLLDKARNLNEAKSVLSKIFSFMDKDLDALDGLVATEASTVLRVELSAGELKAFKVGRDKRTRKSGKIADVTYVPPSTVEMKKIRAQWSVIARNYSLLEDLEDVHLPRLYQQYGKSAKDLFKPFEANLKALKTKINEALKIVQQYGKRRPPKLVTSVISEVQLLLNKALTGRFNAPMRTQVYVGLVTDEDNTKDKTLGFFYYFNFENFTTDTGNKYPDWYVVVVAVVNEDGEISFRAQVPGKFVLPSDLDVDHTQSFPDADSIVEEIEKQFFQVYSMNVLRPLALPVDSKIITDQKGTLNASKFVDSVKVEGNEIYIKLVKGLKAVDVDQVMRELMPTLKSLLGLTTKDKRLMQYNLDTQGHNQVIVVTLHAAPGKILNSNVNYKVAREVLKTRWGLDDETIEDIVQLVNRKKHGYRK